MPSTESRPNKSPVSWLARPLRWLLMAVWFLCRVLLIAWPTLAIYWSNLPWAWLRLGLALAFLMFSVYVFWWARRLRMHVLFAGLFFIVLMWFISIRPTHNRPWRPDVAVMPRVTIDGDRVRITGVRNFDYRSRTDFTERWEEREVQVSHLTSIDFFVSYWMPGPVAHTFLSFNFDNAPPLCMSIEARPVAGEGFEPIRSMFKQFELIYVVGDEHDVVGVRTNFRDEDVYMYRIHASAASARALFLIYLDRINQLADHPEWYHLLSNNCTLNIVRYARAVGKPAGFDIRFLLNGLVDRWLYSLGLLDTSMPFRELRERSLINKAAQAAADSPDFSERIRASLPSPQP